MEPTNINAGKSIAGGLCMPLLAVQQRGTASGAFAVAVLRDLQSLVELRYV